MADPPHGPPGVFLDRDGTLNVPPPYGRYVTRWDAFAFLPGVIESLARLRRAGVRTVLATNQACVAKGLARAEDIDDLHARMQKELARRNAALDRVQYCPHDDAAGCACRKPGPGLIEQGMKALGLDRRRCAMVGDSSRDLKAGRAAGVVTVWVKGRAYREDYEKACAVGADHVCETLGEAVDWLLERLGLTPEP